MGGEQRERARIARLPEPLEHPGAIRTEGLRLDPLDDHQLARLGAAGIGATQLELAHVGADRPDRETLADALDRADHAHRRPRQDADDLALGLVAPPADPRQHAIADPGRPPRAASCSSTIGAAPGPSCAFPAGLAISSPSGSIPVTSSTATEGSRPVLCRALPATLGRRGSSSRSRRFSSVRSCPLSWKARASSRRLAASGLCSM